METTDISPYPQESLLIDSLGEIAGERILCTSPGLAQFGAAAAQNLPKAQVTCTYLDAYRANLTVEHWKNRLPNLRFECAADLPAVDAEVVALPFSANGEAELTREFIQTAHQRLVSGGMLYATTDRPEDVWLGKQLARSFGKIRRRQTTTGVLYSAAKAEPLRKVKDYSCEFAFRDRGRLIRAFSRPGVFSHRHIDPGARHLINAMQIEPGMHVLDIGCGAGTVALAAACRAEDVQVHAVDSNARAVECTRRGAVLNELENVTAELNPGGDYRGIGTYDLALANPPYYSGFRISSHFLAAGRESLRPGGALLLVTKHPAWYDENMPQWFDNVLASERKGYWLFCGTRPR